MFAYHKNFVDVIVDFFVDNVVQLLSVFMLKKLLNCCYLFCFCFDVGCFSIQPSFNGQFCLAIMKV